MARFWLEVTMMTCSMPAATASSTAYWMIGLSTRGSISFGCALVAGRKRVPQPAAGKTALRTRIELRGLRMWIRGGRGRPVYHRPPSGPVRRPGRARSAARAVVFRGEQRRLRPAREPELGQDVRDVRAGRPLGDAELVGDRPIRE